MSELKTFRCDICGKPYYSDEAKANLTIGRKDEDDKNEKICEHICNECVVAFSKLMVAPSIIDDLTNEKDEWITYASKMEFILKSLRDDLCGWRGALLGCTFDDKKSYAEMLSEEIEDKYTEIEKSRERWISFACLMIGICAGLIVFL